MLDHIISFSIKNKLVVGLMMLGLVAWGAYSLSKLPIDAVPDITNNQVQIITLSSALGAEDVERLITFPIEQAVANVPHIEEVRSFSRVGLSLITVVFQDDADIYWARQQITERLRSVQTQIPQGTGIPELAPISTGLGEIYQYVVRPAKGYEHQYSLADLRAMQDWVIRRQLLGTAGVADVSSFGGHLKQYEIAIDPQRLAAMNVSLTELFNAIAQNNANTGGAYIEKNPNAYFIRTEGLLKNIQDIENVVVKNITAGTPILVRDVAKVQYGRALPYGALLKDGKEVTGGVVLMLKGENSKNVVKLVKEKMKQIQTSLPKGVMIEPFLDRTKLVDDAIGTVSKNLIEGALIVVLVLVLLLGNLRAGLVVASVIPLAMLFAVCMMNVFGVSGNLMSLGAIDFGLIVDGAVIIVETVLHQITVVGATTALNKTTVDNIVKQSSHRMMRSASFGQIIILVVYLPLLTLVGIEGKMFKPMAETVAFALLGALLLSLTYVPALSALTLGKQGKQHFKFSDKLIEKLQKSYLPILHAVLKRKTQTIIVALGLFIVALIIFLNMGGEFIPTLDEGDFACETRVLTGSSLTHTIDVCSKASTILRNQFPEVKQVVAKVGTGEIPTDPMPLEAADLMIILKPKKEWTSAHTREELAEKMTQALSVLPEATFGMQQPIAMRFNELMTGAKQDVVLKIYGEDLNQLANLSNQVARVIHEVSGVSDLYVEPITGLPQIVVKLNRERMAQFGIVEQTLNEAIQTSFAGAKAGMVYEGERRFDIVIRLSENNRQQISDVKQLLIQTPNGQTIPLQELADVNLVNAPNQIQRDNTQRRIMVGFNVRNSDVETVVNTIKTQIAKKLSLPAGYHIQYGGQFQNLQKAKNRLSVAVPVALLLIFVLLFFAFNSIKQALLILSAIPLSAIGGVFALLLRGMPFSISAGVGFIALFGIAVLNGIVLIAQFNHLKQEGIADVTQRIIQGTLTRLRPITMTAAVASLGFLPMAISSSSGAEVQKPLATVVIGGLVTATLLTLLLLPVLYYFSEKDLRMRKPLSKNIPALLMLLGMLPFVGRAQSKLTVTEATQIGLENNVELKSIYYDAEIAKRMIPIATDFGKTSVSFQYGHINSPQNDNSAGISQTIPFPIILKHQYQLANLHTQSQSQQFKIAQKNLKQAIQLAYYQWAYFYEQRQLLIKQDSLTQALLKTIQVRFQTGDVGVIDVNQAEMQAIIIQNQLKQNQADYLSAQKKLAMFLNQPNIAHEPAPLKRIIFKQEQAISIEQTQDYQWLKMQEQYAHNQLSLEKAKRLPDITLGLNHQTFNPMPSNTPADGLENGKRYLTYQFGIAIPLNFFVAKAKIAVAKLTITKAQNETQKQKINMQTQFDQLLINYYQHQQALDSYETQLLNRAKQAIEYAQIAFKNGEITYFQYTQSIKMAIDLMQNHLQLIYQNNQTVVQLQYYFE